MNLPVPKGASFGYRMGIYIRNTDTLFNETLADKFSRFLEFGQQ